MIKNRLILGITVGLLADAVKLTVNYLSFRLKFTPVVFWQLIAALFLQKKDVFTPAGIAVGGIADLIVTSFLGVLFIYFLYFTGTENLWLKGIGFGMLVWVSVLGVFLIQLIKATIPSEPSGVFVTIAAHFAFGLALAAFTKLLGKDMPTFAWDWKHNEPVRYMPVKTHVDEKAPVRKEEDFIKPEKI